MEKKSPDPLLEEVETFLAEMSISPSAFGESAVRSGHLVAKLRGGRQCRPATIARVRAYMQEVRDEEGGKVAETARAVARLGGFITFRSDGEFDSIPDGVDEHRLRRMIAAGLLVPSGDSMFGAVSQTYRLSAIAR